MSATKIISITAGVLSVLGALYAAGAWVDSRFATKKDMQTVFVEVRLHQVDESILSYQRLGLATLGDIDRDRYDLLKTSRGKLEEQRKTLLGLQ